MILFSRIASGESFKAYPHKHDFRKLGVNIKMDKRIAVDGKRICWASARIPSSNACEALKYCQSDALRFFEMRLFELDESKGKRKIKSSDKSGAYSYP